MKKDQPVLKKFNFMIFSVAVIRLFVREYRCDDIKP